MFFRKIPVSKFLVYFEKTDARHEQLWYGAGQVTGPPTPPGYGIPTHLPTPKSFVNANFLAESYLRQVGKSEGSNAQGLDGPHCRFTITNFSNSKVLFQ